MLGAVPVSAAGCLSLPQRWQRGFLVLSRSKWASSRISRPRSSFISLLSLADEPVHFLEWFDPRGVQAVERVGMRLERVDPAVHVGNPLPNKRDQVGPVVGTQEFPHG